MSNYKNISIENYTYELPPDKIACYPLTERDTSNLLVFNDGQIEKDTFCHIADYLPHDSLMVFNNTRVVQARLLFRKSTGACIEIFCLEPMGADRDIQQAFQQTHKSSWFCLVGNAKKWKKGALSLSDDTGLMLKATRGATVKDGYIVHFEWHDETLPFAEVLERAGKTPLPPYISRSAEESDKLRYQTIFARHAGSVAAPTAGLHFTDNVMESLAKRNISPVSITLHVGAGTFKPVTSETLKDHAMHHEQIVFTRQTIEQLLSFCTKDIISVGTTSMRSLESLYWLGVKLGNGYRIPESGFEITQWEPYENSMCITDIGEYAYGGKDKVQDSNNTSKLLSEKLPKSTVSATQSLEVIIKYMNEKGLEEIHGETALIIVPGYQFQLANILVTNFHQPQSTLLLLVAAFCGDQWRSIYNFALNNDFRFLSYGDSCLLFGQKGALGR